MKPVIITCVKQYDAGVSTFWNMLVYTRQTGAKWVSENRSFAVDNRWMLIHASEGRISEIIPLYDDEPTP